MTVINVANFINSLTPWGKLIITIALSLQNFIVTRSKITVLIINLGTYVINFIAINDTRHLIKSPMQIRKREV